MSGQVEGKAAVIRAALDTTLSPGELIVSIEDRPVEACLTQQIKRVCNSTQKSGRPITLKA